MTYISAQSYVSEKGWGKATLEKSLEAQWRGNSSPRGTAGTQTRPWTEIYQDRTSTDENIYRVEGRTGLASYLPATVNLVLFQNVNKHDWKENILHILKVRWLRAVVSGWYRWHYQSRQHKTICTWEERGEGRGSWDILGLRVEQGLLHERGNSTKATGLYLVASSHGGTGGWIGEIIVANTMQLTGVGCQWVRKPKMFVLFFLVFRLVEDIITCVSYCLAVSLTG